MAGDHDPEFPARMSEVIKQLGGDAAVGQLLGVHAKTVAAYRLGKSDPQLSQIVAIARRAEVRVGWLATGESPREVRGSNAPPELDDRELYEIITTVEEYLRLTRRERSPEVKARVMIDLYKEVMARRSAGGNDYTDAERLRFIDARTACPERSTC